MITVRTVQIKDYEFINKWWLGWGEDSAPKLIDLPNMGLGGVVVEKNNIPIAVNYIYLTNSNMAYLANAISNPNYKGKDRMQIIQVLLDECVRRAKSLGCTFIWCTSNERGVIERCKKSGFVVVDQQSIIIKSTK
ncbi:MAG: hypothetical protein CMI60_02835 [Parvibaculum sp.]|nr:hypothetical protein [Parvibaculum sp.]